MRWDINKNIVHIRKGIKDFGRILVKKNQNKTLSGQVYIKGISFQMRVYIREVRKCHVTIFHDQSEFESYKFQE